MDAPANTLNYMIAGYTVIFIVIIVYLVSLSVRWRRARQELERLEIIRQLETKGKPAGKS